MWKPIPGWELYYAVNEFGDVKSLRSGNLVVGDENNAGYCRVCLYDGDRRERFFRHRLVAKMFIPNANSYVEVNHINGNKHDNRVSNLEWCSRIQNERHARRSNLKEYKPYEVEYKDGTVRRFEFVSELADILNVSKRTILNYLQRKNFAFLEKGIKNIKYINA